MSARRRYFARRKGNIFPAVRGGAKWRGALLGLTLAGDKWEVGGRVIEEHLEVVKRRSLLVSLVMVLGVRPVFPAAAVYILSVLPTCGTLQYVGINTPLQTAAALLNPFSPKF